MPLGAGGELGRGFSGSQHSRHCAVMKESLKKFLFSICNRAKGTTVHVLQYNTVQQMREITKNVNKDPNKIAFCYFQLFYEKEVYSVDKSVFRLQLIIKQFLKGQYIYFELFERGIETLRCLKSICTSKFYPKTVPQKVMSFLHTVHRIIFLTPKGVQQWNLILYAII